MLVKRFFAFWFDFIIGDDWTVAAGVVLLLAVAAGLAYANLQTATWIIVPAGVAGILTISLRRATTEAKPQPLHAFSASLQPPTTAHAGPPARTSAPGETVKLSMRSPSTEPR